jgi:hypothetical protein
MSNSEERLQKELQLFIILMKKMRERDSNMGFLTDEDKMMIKGLDFVILNYEQAGPQIPVGFTDDMIESYTQMLHFVTSALMEELDGSGVYLTDEEQRIYNEVHNVFNNDQINIDKSLPIPSIDQLLDKTDTAIPMKHRLMMAIQEIDQQITPDIEGALVDDLLDRRLELLDELKKFS